MTTSGTAAANFDVLEIIEEAYERAGLIARTAYDIRTARRSLNLLAMEWANRGLNLWSVQQGTVSLVAGTAQYTLPADTIDLIEMTVNLAGTDYHIDRISVSDFSAVPNKTTTGRPLQAYVARTVPPSITVWPVPDTAYTLTYFRLRRMQDVTAGSQTLDLPFRFLPACIAGLAFHIAMKRPEAAARAPALQAYYEQQFQLAADEDRDRASVFLTPYIA